jgi:hypothetical protein
MKGLYSVYLFSLLIFITFSSCNQDDEVLSDFPGDEYMTAKIDGEVFSINKQQGNLITAKFIETSGLINLHVSANSLEGETLEFLISDYTGPATYLVRDIFSNNNELKYKHTQGEWVPSFEGEENNPNQITVLEDGGNFVKGTFHFEGHNMSDGSVKIISEGKFQVGIVPK